MTLERTEAHRPRPRPVRRRSGLRFLIGAALTLIVFALGVALGQALEGPDTGGIVTYGRTLSVPDETVTVTVPG